MKDVVVSKSHVPRFQEEYSAKLPALALLSNLGWSFLSPEPVLSARDGKYDQVVLRGAIPEESYNK